jgi:hypothetical protein
METVGAVVGNVRAVGHGVGIRRRFLAVGLATTLLAGGLVATAQPASARVEPKPSVADSVLSPRELAAQLKVANGLRAGLMRSDASVAAANSRLERLAAQATKLLADISATRTAQSAAEAEVAAQQARLRQLDTQVQEARRTLGQLASDSYARGGGPLGDVAAMLEALTAPSPNQSNDSLATIHYLVNARARILIRLRTVQAAQATTSAKAVSASQRATAAAKRAEKAKVVLDAVIAEQRSALTGFETAEAAQVRRAAKVRGALLRSENPWARAADRQLAASLQGQDYSLLLTQTSRCGLVRGTYSNGRWPSRALCPLYAAPGQSLRRAAALAFNAMSSAYQRQTGSALCVTDAYRSYAEQVAVKRATPRMAATPGTSKHGLGLAVDLCGGVQSFASPAHLWMKRNGPIYGWFHPAWAEPHGGLPEPWHWEFAS